MSEGTAAPVKIQVAKPVHKRLAELQSERCREKGRFVSFSEVMDELLDEWRKREQG